jgi:hypothetical protein
MIITLPWRRMTLQRSQRRFTDVEIFTGRRSRSYFSR